LGRPPGRSLMGGYEAKARGLGGPRGRDGAWGLAGQQGAWERKRARGRLAVVHTTGGSFARAGPALVGG